MDSERLRKVNQAWSSVFDRFDKKNIQRTTFRFKKEESITTFINDFEHSNYQNYFIVRKNPVANEVFVSRNINNFPAKFKEGGKIVMIADFQTKNIKKALSLGYDKLVEGMISRNRKGVMLINDNYEVMGTYDIGQKEAIQKIINEQKQNKMNKRPEWLFVGTYPNALMFADKRKEKGGDYHEIGRIVFSQFEIKIYDESSKYSEVHKIMQEEFDKIEKEGSVQVSSTGQRVNIKKYAEGGDMAGFDWNSIYTPLNPEQEKEWELKMQQEKRADVIAEKNSLKERIRATGKDWEDATKLRIESVKKDLQGMNNSFSKNDAMGVQDWYNYFKEDIALLREMGFEAKEYANNLSKTGQESYEKYMNKLYYGKKFATGGGINGKLSTTYENPIEYLKAMGASIPTDLNYSTEKNGVNYYIGYLGTKALVVAFIEDDDNYMIDKEDAREMSLTARTKGIETVELYTNYGIELHSKHENPKTIGFDKIYKVSVGNFYEKGGEMHDQTQNLLGELWFAVHEREPNKFGEIAKKLDAAKVPFHIQNEVSADASSMRYKKHIDVSEVHTRIKNILNSNKFEKGGYIEVECVFEAQTKGGKHALKIYKDSNGTYHREELTNNNIRSTSTYPTREAAELAINQEIDGALKLDNIAYGVTKNDENFNILKVNKSESLIPIARLKYLLGHNLTEEEKVIVRGQEIAVKALKNDIKATGIDTEEFGDEITKATKHAYPEPEVEMAYEILKQNKFASGGEILIRFIPEEELMAKLKGQTILDYAIGEDEPSYTRIERAYITPKHFDKREVVLETARNFEVRFPLEKLPKFLNLEEVVLKGDKFIHAIQLSQFLKDIYKKNRVVKVNYDNGDSITTEMSGTLTDSEIRDYYKVGRSFNIGSGEHDKMAKVKSVEILYADGGKIEENPTVIIISSSAPLSSQLSELTGKSWNDIDFNSEGDYLSSREFYEVETGKKFKAYTVSEAKELGASGIMIPSLGAIHSVYQMIKEEGDNAAVAYYVGKNFLTEKAMSSILGGYATGMSPEEIHKLIASLAKRKKFEKGGVIEDAWAREKINDFLISAGQDKVDFRDDESLAGRSNGTYGLVIFDTDDKEKTLYLNFKNSKEAKMAYGELVTSLSNPYLFSSRFDLMPTTIMVQLEGEDIIYKDGGHLPLKDNFKKGYKSFAKELFESDAYYGKAQLEKDLEEYKTLLYGLEKGKISPETVVGSGFENPKEYAKNFLTKRINAIKYTLDTKGLGSPVIISEFKRAINLSLAKNSISKDEHVELLDSLYETTSSLPAKYKKGGAIGDIDEETVIIPEIVAQRTAEDVVYKIFENQLKGWSDLEEADKKYLDKKISKKTNEVAKYLVERANTIYKHNPDFRKKINGEKGLEYLYMFMAHWSGMNNGKQTSSIDKIIEKWNKSKK